MIRVRSVAFALPFAFLDLSFIFGKVFHNYFTALESAVLVGRGRG